jgi:hypothetical protein
VREEQVAVAQVVHQQLEPLARQTLVVAAAAAEHQMALVAQAVRA